MTEFKVGDWVAVTEEVDGNISKVGTIGILDRIDTNDCSIPYIVSGSWCRRIRLATLQEIPTQFRPKITLTKQQKEQLIKTIKEI